MKTIVQGLTMPLLYSCCLGYYAFPATLGGLYGRGGELYEQMVGFVVALRRMVDEYKEE
jgi:hypothetical protein